MREWSWARAGSAVEDEWSISSSSTSSSSSSSSLFERMRRRPGGSATSLTSLEVEEPRKTGRGIWPPSKEDVAASKEGAFCNVDWII